ncbi:thioredoxin [Candidatus Dependentiae bacterium]|nr:MAG: thioredoxin [Candidatus Dependentiae bacterium]
MKEKYLYIMLTVYSFMVHMPIKCIAPRFIDDDQEFETMLTYNQKPMFVIFSAAWCGICTSFKNTFNQLTEHPLFKDTVSFITINFDKAKRVCEKHKVDRIPTFVYIKNGEILRKDVGIKRGVDTKEFFENTITETFNLQTPNQKVANSNVSVKSTIAYFAVQPLQYIKDGIEWCIQKLST